MRPPTVAAEESLRKSRREIIVAVVSYLNGEKSDDLILKGF
jgi:hypothetical protein